MKFLAWATLLLAVVAAARTFDPLREGLTATYFSDQAWTSTPTRTEIERQPSTDAIFEAWYGRPPASFSATWAGSIFTAHSGRYTFATESDDGSWLYVDGRLVVDNGGGHAAKLVRGAVDLDRGVHDIFIKYFQEGGDLQLDVRWSRGDGTLESIPSWALSTREMEPPRTFASVVVRRAVAPAFAVWIIAFALCAVAHREWIAARWAIVGARPAQMSVIALAVFAALAAVHTWPLASNPAHLSRNDNGDTLLNTWAIAWVAHQLPRDPRHLFDGNIFYPARLTLGYSEAMIVQGVMAMPVLALGGSPVLAYNLVLLAGFTLTAWSFFLLMWRWTRNWSAAYVSGALAGFNAHVLVQLPHLQFQHLEFVAPMLFALDRLVTARRVRDSFWLGIAYALQGLTSIYLLVFATWMLIFAALARAGEWLRDRPARAVALFAVAGAVGAIVMWPYLSAYMQLHNLTGMERSVDAVRANAGRPIDYLETGSRIHYALWSHRFDVLTRADDFPGVTAIVLVVLALRWPETRRDRRLQMCGAAAIGCAAVSMLPYTPIYPALHEAILLLRAVRATAHLGEIVLLMIAVIGGFGVAGLARRWRSPRTWPVMAFALFAAVTVEALRAPLDYTPFSKIPDVYAVLASERDAVVVELPFPSVQAMFLNAPYMLSSTKHWRPILNGHSGFTPDAYPEMYEQFSTFPDTASLAAMRRWGVTHVVVHGSPVDTLKVPALVPVASDGSITIYRLR